MKERNCYNRKMQNQHNVTKVRVFPNPETPTVSPFTQYGYIANAVRSLIWQVLGQETSLNGVIEAILRAECKCK